MKLKRDMAGIVFGLVCVGMLMPSDALAYIDPGTGSMILQLLLGGVAGALLIGKMYWQKLLAFFRPDSKASQDEAEETGDGRKEGDA